MQMQDVFGKPDEETQVEQPQGEQQPAETQETAPEQAATDAPPASDTGKHVPLAALEAERKGRQDWKEKAIAAEARLKAFEEREQQARQEQREPEQIDPIERVQARIDAARFNTSEMFMREKHEDLDAVVDVFIDQAKQNPALAAQMNAHPHPWKFAYEEGKRMRFAAEIGDDPDAYRKKVEAEVRASIGATPPAPVPQSLAGARSAGARGVTFTGPVPLNSMFRN